MIKNMREVVYGPLPKNGFIRLVGDIGGTNGNFGFFDRVDETSRLLMSLHIKTATIVDPAQVIGELVDYVRAAYQMRIIEACIGAAGIVRRDRLSVSLTNAPITLDAHAIAVAAGLERVVLINDFEAAGLGIELLPSASLYMINRGSEHHKANRVLLGAGTGMGKAALIWQSYCHAYIPVVSEGGHADAVPYDSRDMELFEFVKKERGLDYPISWEDLLSGRGITMIYKFLGTESDYSETAVSKEIEENRFQPDKISAYAQKDPRSADTFAWYTLLYARCAKNFALDLLARGGIFLAGGIAAKNVALFRDKRFIEEFTRSYRYHDLLADIRIDVLLDYNVSLYGAHRFLQLHDAGMI